MTDTLQLLIEKFTRLDEPHQQAVLEFVSQMETNMEQSPAPTYTPLELMKLPLAERNRILAEQFGRAADEDFEIFEANADEDFDEYDD